MIRRQTCANEHVPTTSLKDGKRVWLDAAQTEACGCWMARHTVVVVVLLSEAHVQRIGLVKPTGVLPFMAAIAAAACATHQRRIT